MSGRRLTGILTLIRREAIGLFVDDGAFAGAILLWLVIAGGLLPRLHLPGWIAGLLLFGGLAGILIWGALRTTRRRGF